MKTNRLHFLGLFCLMNTCIYARSVDSFKPFRLSVWRLGLPNQFIRVGEQSESDPGRTLANGLPISVRPNPSNRKIDIDLLIPENQICVVGVTDLLGQTLLKRDVVGKGIKQLETIDLDGKYSGTMLVYLQNGLQQIGIMVLLK